jgi:hypothetical protein
MVIRGDFQRQSRVVQTKLIETRSGSQYTLYDNRYGSTGYAGSILADYVKAAKESDGKYSVEPLSEEDSIAYLKSLTN